MHHSLGSLNHAYHILCKSPTKKLTDECIGCCFNLNTLDTWQIGETGCCSPWFRFCLLFCLTVSGMFLVRSRTYWRQRRHTLSSAPGKTWIWSQYEHLQMLSWNGCTQGQKKKKKKRLRSPANFDEKCLWLVESCDTPAGGQKQWWTLWTLI